MTNSSGINTHKIQDNEVASVVHKLLLSETYNSDTFKKICRQVKTVMNAHYDKSKCTNCHHTGVLFNLFMKQTVEKGVVDYEVATSYCPCVHFINYNISINHKIDKIMIPEKYKDAHLARWVNPGTKKSQIDSNTETYRLINRYDTSIRRMKEKGYGLFLCGPNGVGKTYLACAVAISAAKAGFNVRYYTMPKIIRSVVDNWFSNDVRDIVDDIEKSDFLIIDDVDKAYKAKTKLDVTVLDNLFRERLQNNRPMIVTSNMTLKQIKEQYGNSVHSMFVEHCAECILVGNDYRNKIAKSIIDDIMLND